MEGCRVSSEPGVLLPYTDCPERAGSSESVVPDTGTANLVKR